MPDIFWLGFGIALVSTLVVSAARSRSTPALTGLAIGAFLGVLAGFPLLAIGLSTA
jgi:presenilin-like A22 family membrane protease